MMEITLKGTHEEVMGLMRAMAGATGEIASWSVGPPAQLPTPEPAQPPVSTAEVPPSFKSMVEEWAIGFDMDGRSHWDDPEAAKGNANKGEALRDLGNSRGAGKIITWIHSQGGLTHAVHQILDGDPKLARGIAVNIAQVASILFTDLGETLEHFDPFED